MERYRLLSLISMAQNGYPDAITELALENIDYALDIIDSLPIGDRDEMVGVASKAITDAIDSYSIFSDTSFREYVENKIREAIIDYIMDGCDGHDTCA